MGADPKNSGPGKRLSDEERLAIPSLYVLYGSATKVAEALGCGRNTVQRWLDNLSGEEWDRIQEEQRKVLLQKSVDILYSCLDLLPGKVGDATVRDLLGAVKIIRESIAAWGGVGAAGVRSSENLGELEAMLAAADNKRRQDAIEKALATGDLETLNAFGPKEEKVEVSV